jgi:formylglycine-generating enzyme required for sulfatase activity
MKNTIFTIILWMLVQCIIAQGYTPSKSHSYGTLVTSSQRINILSSQPINESLITKGEIAMGDHFGFVDPSHPSDEIPIHTVLVDSFYIAKMETTNQQFLLFLNSMKDAGSITVQNNRVYLTGDTNTLYMTNQYASYYSIGYNGTSFYIADFRANHPVVGVMWCGSAVYCNWLSLQNGLQSCYNTQTWNCDLTKNGYRLPSEAEWEYAARGGHTDPYYNYPTGNSLDISQANLPNSGDPYETGSFPYTTPVGFYDGLLKNKTDFNWPGSATTYQTTSGVNSYGLYDMQGNVWEFVNDWYGQNYYSSSSYDNPTGPASGTTMPDGKTYRGMRGGNWYNGSDISGLNDGHSRVSNRNPTYYRGPEDPYHPWYHIGFRVARSFAASTTTSVTNTVGLFINDTTYSFAGYTLFAPKHNTMTYLINNAGKKVHEWTASTYNPGQSVYLLENGDLLRTCQVMGQLGSGGGEGGRIEQYNWNDSLIWQFNYSTANYTQHHDIKRLPNGHIIMLVVEKKTLAEATAAGFNPNNFQPDVLQKGYLLPDCIIEIEPVPPSGGNIVWEWHVWNHLIQDYDAAQSNYGVVASHPELIDCDGDHRKIPLFWNHMNSIDYNPALDQIVVSVRGNSELWIVDHSTTTVQSASHTGGAHGKGGDLLYRWGNPLTYGVGNVSNEKYFEQHDVEWVKTDCPGAGNLTCFNNGVGRDFSTVDEITPPVDASGNYALTTGSAYGPGGLTWTYQATPSSALFAHDISGAQRLQNGNTLIDDGPKGTFTEVTSSGMVVWKYINPTDNLGPVTQGDTLSYDPSHPEETMNSVFRVYRYAQSYAAFTGRDLTPGDFIELYSPKTVNLTLMMEGLYAGNNTMNQAKDASGVHWTSPIADKITVELHSGTNYSNIIYSTTNLSLSTTGVATFLVPRSDSGNYYITIKHRNHIPITTITPVSFSSSTIDYAFNQPSKVFGGNLILMSDGRYAVYAGDVNQDGLVDGSDLSRTGNDSDMFLKGYLTNDSNGDGLVDGSDLNLIGNNNDLFIRAILP